MPDIGEPQSGATPAVQDLSGTTIGRFEVQNRIGAGGMGEVYRALDTKLRRTVALKRLAPRLRSDEQFRRRLLLEAQSASALSDRHIAGIYDVLEEGGETFLVMEYVEGRTLREVLKDPVDLQDFLNIALDCLEGLVAAHGKGIVHHDIKPENIILTDGQLVKILDFGVARRLPRDEGFVSTDPLTIAQTDLFGGTPPYMAPEVLLGQAADHRADLFSLGVVFYEILTRRHPFRSDNIVATVDRILHESPPDPSSFNAEIPPPLVRTVERMLAKRPEDRPASADVLLEEFRRLRLSIPFLSRLFRMRPRIPQKRLLWVAGVVIAVVAALFAALRWEALRQGFPARWVGGGYEVPAQKLLAVLPFTNISQDSAGQVVCDGLTEILTIKLTQMEQFQKSLRVISAHEVRSEGIAGAREARRAFGVTLAVTGSVQRTGDRGRLAVALVDAGSQLQLKTATIDFQAGDLYALQDGALQKVVQMLELELEPDVRRVLAAGDTDVPGAYEFYLQGRGYLYRYDRPENLDSAIAMFQQALEQDPNYALAYAGRAEAYWRKFDVTRNAAFIDQARESCARALEINDRSAPAHVTMGLIHSGTGRYEQAVEEFQRALKLDPFSADAYRELAAVYESMGRLQDAESTYRKAIDLRSEYWAGYNHLGVFYWRHGRYTEAESLFRKVIQLTPDNDRGYSNLGGVYHLQGKDEEAAEMLERSLAIKPTPEAHTNLGIVYYYQGRHAEAVSTMEKAIAMGGGNYVLWGNLADAYRQLPQKEDEAAAAYRKAIELATKQLSVNPRNAPLRASLSVYSAKLGDCRNAITQVEEALNWSPDDVNVLFRSVLAYELCGMRELALRMLKAAMAGGYSKEEIRKAPHLTELRKDKRFGQLMADHPPAAPKQ